MPDVQHRLDIVCRDSDECPPNDAMTLTSRLAQIGYPVAVYVGDWAGLALLGTA